MTETKEPSKSQPSNTTLEHQMAEQAFHNAKFLLHKLSETEWRLKDLQLEVIRKYAHLSELANSLKYLPIMIGEEETVEDIQREAQFLFESTLSSFAGFKQRFEEREEKLHRHMYAVGQAFYKPVAAQCVCDEQKDGKEQECSNS